MKLKLLIPVIGFIIVILTPNICQADTEQKEIIIVLPDGNSEVIGLMEGNTDDWDILTLSLQAMQVIINDTQIKFLTNVTVLPQLAYYIVQYRDDQINKWEFFSKLYLLVANRVLTSNPLTAMTIYVSEVAFGVLLDVLIQAFSIDVPTVKVDVDGEQHWKQIYLDVSSTADVSVNVQVTCGDGIYEVRKV